MPCVIIVANTLGFPKVLFGGLIYFSFIHQKIIMEK